MTAPPWSLSPTSERLCDQSNRARALAVVFEAAGLAWATPHTLRRTVATRLHAQGVPPVVIADAMGHADPSMTARVHLGRDPFAERPDVARHLSLTAPARATGN